MSPPHMLNKMVALLSVMACFSPVASRADDSDVARFRTIVLRSHNSERLRWQVPPLRWNSALAAEAQAHAEELARSGTISHGRVGGAKPQGENLWIGTRSAYHYEDMVGAFLRERNHYVAGAFPQTSTTGNWSDTGHYSQMIWRTTTQVGCGMASGARFDVLVCRYDPAGNIRGQRADASEAEGGGKATARPMQMASLDDRRF